MISKFFYLKPMRNLVLITAILGFGLTGCSERPNDVAKGELIKKLVTGYKSNEYRRFVENDPKAKGFSRPEYWR